MKLENLFVKSTRMFIDLPKSALNNFSCFEVIVIIYSQCIILPQIVEGMESLHYFPWILFPVLFGAANLILQCSFRVQLHLKESLLL